MRVLLLLTCSTAMAAPAVKWADIPLSFEPNTGQAAENVRYVARAANYTVFLTDNYTVFAGRDQPALRMTMPGSDPSARISGEGPQPSTSSYFVGNNPTKWRASVANYERVRYSGVYPGIDLVYYGQESKLEYDWILSPGADPKKIRLKFDGADRLHINKDGDLVIHLGRSEYLHRKPVIYQQPGAKRIPIAGQWSLHGKEARFQVGAYNREERLIIDPALIYSTYLGGAGLDFAYAVAVDQNGNTYITGSTGSANFPNVRPLEGTLRGSVDVFVTKINANGTAKFFSTYLGGGGVDEGKGIAVDAAGNIYVAGNAGSFDFPTMGAIQSTWGGSGDAFLTKLNAGGSGLIYSTYLGGNAIDYATSVALDPAGNAYIAGVTFSTNFPTVHALQATKGAQQDAFVAKINPAGTAWIYATYLGGNNVDEGYAIAADAAGNAYVTGYTASTNFPLQSAYRGSNVNTVDAFVTKLNPAGSALVYSTYLGGSGTDYGTGIAVDSAGNTYVTGVAGAGSAMDFPRAGGVQAQFGGADDAFVTEFNPSASALIYSTFLGGGSVDQPYAIAIDQSGNAYITGRTNSSDFPLANALQTNRVAFDMFVAKISAGGSSLLFSTFLGGAGDEAGRGIAVDRRGNMHVVGESTSANFPVANALQMFNGGGAASQDAVVVLLGDSPWPPPTPLGYFAVTPCRAADTRASQGKTGAFGTPPLAAYVARDFPLVQSGCGLPAAAQAYSLNFTAVPPGRLDFLSAWPTGQPYPGVSTLNSSDGSVIANAAILPAGTNGNVQVVAGQSTDLIIDANGYFGPLNGNELAFYAVTPCRVADTRTSQPFTGAFGPPALAAYVGRIFPVRNSGCNIASSAQAYSLNLTVIPQGPLSFLSIWPADKPYPGVSTLNSFDGSIIANAAIVPAGANGDVEVIGGNPTEFIMDINGYFGPAGGQGALHFYPLPPCRVADTRADQGYTGAFGPPALGAYVTRDFPILSSNCAIAPTAKAYSLNLTVVPQRHLDFLSTWAAANPYPGVSTLNSPKGTVLANAAIVPAGLNGSISIVAGNPTDLIIDINGYFAP